MNECPRVKGNRQMLRANNLCKPHEQSAFALLLIDVINDLDFPGNERIVQEVDALAETLYRLKKGARELNIPVVYVNDNFGNWQSNFIQLIEHCKQRHVPGKILADKLTPDKNDFFVLKPMHSGFFATPLEVLLKHLGVEELIIAGIAGNICVLYTANDAYMHGYKLHVPSDAILSNTIDEDSYAVAQMEKLLKANVQTSSDLIKTLEARLENQAVSGVESRV